MKTKPEPQADKHPISMRMPGELRGWIKQQAVKNHRSFTSEIIHRLTQMQLQEEKAHV